jgi:hypothetical protein
MGPDIGLDTETNGLDPHSNKVLMLQLSDGQSAFVIDTRTTDISALKEYLESDSIIKIAHNAVFDYSMLKMSTGIELKNIYCTMVAEQVVSAGKKFGEKFGLNSVVLKRLGMYLDKDPSTSFLTIGNSPFTGIQKLYGARDAYILPEIRNQQLLDIEENGIERIIDIEMGCLIPFAEMQLRGCVLDDKKWKLILEYAHVFENRVGKKLKEIFEEVDAQPTLFGLSSINLNSQPQLLTMFRRFGLGMESTSSEELEDNIGKHQAVDLLLEYRTYEKIRAAYGDQLLRLINKVTNRLHPKFNQAYAKTGRSSSCFPEGTLIATNYGLLPIEKITKGDRISTRNGFKEVNDSFFSGVDSLYEIILEDNTSIVCTGNHRVLSNLSWVSVSSLKENDFLYKNTTCNLQETSLMDITNYYPTDFQKKRVYRKENYLTRDLAILLGYSIGDGHLRKGKIKNDSSRPFDKLTLAIDWQDRDLYTYFSSLIKKLFEYDSSYDEYTCIELNLNSTKICEFLSKFGVGNKSVDAAIPLEIFYANSDVCSGFLSGLFEADGNVSHSYPRLCSSSLNLLIGVQNLLYQFGILSKIKEKKDTTGFFTKNKRYNLSIYSRNSLENYYKFIGFLSKRKKEQLEKVILRNKVKNSKYTYTLPKGYDRYSIYLDMKRRRNSLSGKSLYGCFGFRDNRNKTTIQRVLLNKYRKEFVELKNSVVDKALSANDSGLEEVLIKKIIKHDIPVRVYDLSVDGEEFLVNGVVVHNSNPNAQNIPAPKEFDDKLVELSRNNIPEAAFEKALPIPEKDIDDKGASLEDKYVLFYEDGIKKYYVDSKGTTYLYVYDFRDCFISAPGYKIVQCDMPKAEICIMADMSGDKKLIDAINNGEDVYKRAAAE